MDGGSWTRSMALLSSGRGIIVALGGAVSPDLRKVAIVHELSVLEAPAAEQAFGDILRLRPRVVMVEIPRVLDEGLRLIRLLATRARPTALIAVATAHREEVEQTVLDAGATCYLPSTEPGGVGRVLRALLRRAEAMSALTDVGRQREAMIAAGNR